MAIDLDGQQPIGGIVTNPYVIRSWNPNDWAFDQDYDQNIGWVKQLAVKDDVLYILANDVAEGSNQLQEIGRKGLVAIRISADLTYSPADITDWNPQATKVNRFVLDNNTNTMYLGGGLTMGIGGVSHPFLAAVRTDASTPGTYTTSWTPQVVGHGINPGVYEMQLANDILYVGGEFMTIDSQPRRGLAALNLSAVQAGSYTTDWVANLPDLLPDPDPTKETIAVYGRGIYLHDEFVYTLVSVIKNDPTVYGGAPYTYLKAFMASGAAINGDYRTDWDPPQPRSWYPWRWPTHMISGVVGVGDWLYVLMYDQLGARLRTFALDGRTIEPAGPMDSITLSPSSISIRDDALKTEEGVNQAYISATPKDAQGRIVYADNIKYNWSQTGGYFKGGKTLGGISYWTNTTCGTYGVTVSATQGNITRTATTPITIYGECNIEASPVDSVT
ncbi:MAG: hypothetical protein V1906_02525, partial [Candidatus Woesearchaeota archaeon]